MKPATKKVLTIGGVAAGVLLLLGGVANAADDDTQPDDDDDDDENPDVVIVDPPVICPPGQFNVNGVCVTPPPPPPANVCNYVGCPGFVWAQQGVFPNERAFGLRLQQLGYVINPAAANFSMISGYSMSIVRQFQRDYNVARLAQTVEEPPPPSIATDGLVGNAQTIPALIRAWQWVNTLGVPWMDIVALG